MYKSPKFDSTSIETCEIYEGETMEERMRRILNNNEPIEDVAPIIWTERKDGVGAEYNIRTDRFELAIEGMDTVNKSKLAKRMDGIKQREGYVKGADGEWTKSDGGAESIGGTSK